MSEVDRARRARERGDGRTWRERALAAEAEAARLREQETKLVTLIRMGFLVTVNGERGRTDIVNDPAHRELLFTILQAKDVEQAVAALAESG